MKLRSEPLVDVELDASEMSGFRRGCFSEVGAPFCEEVGAFLAGGFPGLIEPWSAPSPVIELIKAWEFGVSAEEFKERGVAGTEKIEEIIGEFFSERLFSAFWPDGVIAWVRALSELCQRRVHSGNIAIGW